MTNFFTDKDNKVHPIGEGSGIGSEHEIQHGTHSETGLLHKLNMNIMRLPLQIRKKLFKKEVPDILESIQEKIEEVQELKKETKTEDGNLSKEEIKDAIEKVEEKIEHLKEELHEAHQEHQEEIHDKIDDAKQEIEILNEELHESSDENSTKMIEEQISEQKEKIDELTTEAKEELKEVKEITKGEHIGFENLEKEVTEQYEIKGVPEERAEEIGKKTAAKVEHEQVGF